MSDTSTITTNTRWSIIATAAVFDVLGLVPLVGWLINAFGYMVIYSWLWWHGLNPVEAFQKAESNWLWFLVEWGLYFAGFSFIPGLTLNAYTSVNMLNTETKTEAGDRLSE
jgi:hypothetical protein